MKAFIVGHIGTIAAVAAYLYLALVSSLPDPGDPRPVSQKVYQTVYTMLHILSNRVVVKYPPPVAPAPSSTPVPPTQGV